MDLNRAKMMAPDLLDWHNATQSFGGLMECWQERSVALGLPITRWVVERNGAQSYLLQYEHTRRWMAKWRTDIVPHDTNANKADPQRGVETLRDIWHWGPGAPTGPGQFRPAQPGGRRHGVAGRGQARPGGHPLPRLAHQRLRDGAMVRRVLVPQDGAGAGPAPHEAPELAAETDTYAWVRQWRKGA
jgi:hypothetical protein